MNDATADVLFSGILAPDDAPPGYQHVAGLIQAAKTPGSGDELGDEDYVVGRFASLVQSPGVAPARKVGRPRMLSHLFSPRLAAVVTVAVLGTGAAGMAVTSVPASTHRSNPAHGALPASHSGLDRLRHGVGTLVVSQAPQSPQAPGATTLTPPPASPPASSTVGASGTTSANRSGTAAPTTPGTGSTTTPGSGTGTHRGAPGAPTLPTTPVPVLSTILPTTLPAAGVTSRSPTLVPPTSVAPTSNSGASTTSAAKSAKETTDSSAQAHAGTPRSDGQARSQAQNR